MAVIIVPLVVLVVAALAYALAANPKLSEMGRLVFFAAALVLLFELSHAVVRLP